ncbi:MAG: pseudouridine synthase [Candidatus Absconditabacterales bacterium]
MKLLSYIQLVHGLARRKIVQAIKEGDILLNGQLIEQYQTELQIGDKLVIDLPQLSVSETIAEVPKITSQLVLFHKPLGCVVSKSDPHNQTIYDLLPQELHSYDYIGRLDKDSSGLLLLTNDKKLVHEMAHPSKGLIKTYLVRIDTELSQEDMDRLKKGLLVNEDSVISVKGDLLKFESVYQESRKGYVQLTAILLEGHKRHIRRLLRAIGKKVYAIHRTAFGKYKLSDLKVGEWQTLKIS